jgi:hypothetical protein
MSEQWFSFKDCSLSPHDLILPDEDCDDPNEDLRWVHYCEVAVKVDRTHVLDCVLSDLDAEDSPLFEFIEDAIAHPHEPGRPKANISDLARLGQSLLNLIAKAVDEQVTLRMAVREIPRD